MVQADPVRIASFEDVSHDRRARADIDAIFFEASGRTTFENDAAKTAFRERWLSRYLVRFPGEAFVARDYEGRVVGYLAGCLEDPARHPLFADISYFSDFAHLTARFPAHLHINVAATHRGMGTGRRLIEAFAAHAVAKSAPGLHAVTGDGVRNNTFYLDCGFRRAGTTQWNGKTIVFFARELP